MQISRASGLRCWFLVYMIEFKEDRYAQPGKADSAFDEVFQIFMMGLQVLEQPF